VLRPRHEARAESVLTEWTVSADYALAAGESKQIPLNVTPKHRGVFTCAISHGSRRAAALRTPNHFAVIVPDTRKALTDSPFGIWCFWGGHSISPDPLLGEKLASIMNKGGWRWTYGGQPNRFKPEAGRTYSSTSRTNTKSR